MANNAIEIKITADNAQAINALKQVADFVRQTSNNTNTDGANAGKGFNEAFSSITSTGNKVISVLGNINSAVNKIASAFNPAAKQGKDAMQQVTDSTNKAGKEIDNTRLKLNKFTGTGVKVNFASNANQTLSVLQQMANAIASLNEKISQFGAMFTANMQEATASAKRASDSIVATFSKVKMPNANPRAPNTNPTGPTSNPSSPSVPSVGNPFKSANEGADGFLDRLSKISIAGYGIVGMFQSIKSIATTVFGTGLSFDQQMETAQMGIAGILTSMTNWNDRQMDLNTAMTISKETLDQINQKAATVGLKTGDLVEGFQSIIAPGLKAKMTLEEMVNLTVMGTKAVKSMLGPQGNSMQITQELRSMVSGTIDQNSQVSRSLGITNEGVEQAKQTAGGLFTYLQDKMKGMDELAKSGTWTQSMTGTIEAFESKYAQASGSAFETVFTTLKTKIQEVTAALFVTDEATKKVSFNPEVLSYLQSFVEYTILFGEKIIVIGNFISQHMLAPLGGVGNILAFIVNNIYGITTAIATWYILEKIITLFKRISAAVTAAKKEIAALGSTATTSIGKMAASVGMATAAVTRLETAFIAVKWAIRALASATLWGAVIMAAGYAVEKVMDYIAKIKGEKPKVDDRSIKGDSSIGALSAKWEAESDPGRVNGANSSDPGGRSYGMYQINSENISGFVDWLESNEWGAGRYLKYGEDTDHGVPAHDVTVGSEEFVNLFKSAGDKFGDSFKNAQTAWATEKYYDPLNELLKGDNLDLNQHSLGIRQAAMSTAIQHGDVASNIIEEAINADGVNNDADFINKIYDIRSRYIANDNFISQEDKDSIINNRLNGDVSERADALSNNNGGWNGAGGQLTQTEIAKQLALKQQEEDATYYKNQQDIMTASIATSKHDVANKLTDIEEERKALQVKFNNTDISEPDYKNQNAGLDYNSQQLKTEGVAREKEIVSNTDFKDALSKSTKLTDLDREYNDQARVLKDFGDVVKDTTAIVNAFKGATKLSEEGSTWEKKDDVDVADLTDNAKGALTAISAKYKELTGENLLVTEGFSNNPIHVLGKGGHNSGNKLDITEGFGSSILQNNKDGIRDQIIEYAKNIGLRVLDEYSDPSTNSNGGHLDIDASGFSLPIADAVKAANGKALTMTGIEIMKSIEALQTEAGGYIEALNAYKGDVSLIQKQQIKTKYKELIEKYSKAGMDGVVSQLQALESLDLKSVDFEQIKKNIEQANVQLALKQIEFMDKVKDGSLSAADAIDGIKKENDEAMKQSIDGLTKLSVAYKEAGAIDKQNEVDDLIKKLKDNVSTFLEETLKALNEKIQTEIDEVNANPNLTNGMKTERIDNLKRQQYTADALAQHTAASADGTAPAESARLRRLAAINAELGKTHTLLEDVYNAGKQGLENGLTSFFTEGYKSCKNLMDAIGGLAESVLNEMNKVYTNQIVRSLMNGWFGGDASSRPSINGVPVQGPVRLNGKFADGGSMDSGQVKGPGSGTSDSVLAYLSNFKKFVGLSNGEYVIKTAAVKKFGTGFFDKLNNGLIPSGFGEVKAKYASGGLLRGVIPSTVSQSMSNAMESFTANLSTGVSPRLSVNNYVDGQRIFDAYGRTLIKSEVRKEYIENAKLYSQINKRMK